MIGSRYMNGISVVNWDLSRLIMSQVANTYARLVTGHAVPRLHERLPVPDRARAGGSGLDSIKTDGYSFLVELKYRVIHAGLRGVEVPIVFTQRRAGTSKISKAEIGRSMITPWKMRLGFWDGGPRSRG